MSTKQEYTVSIFSANIIVYFQTVRSGLEGKKLVASIIRTTRRKVAAEIKAGKGWKYADADRIVILKEGAKVAGNQYDTRKTLTQVEQVATVKF